VAEYELRRLVRRLERADCDVERCERVLRDPHVYNAPLRREELERAAVHRDECKKELDETLARSERGTVVPATEAVRGSREQHED
jgi:hypothetical protein